MDTEQGKPSKAEIKEGGPNSKTMGWQEIWAMDNGADIVISGLVRDVCANSVDDAEIRQELQNQRGFPPNVVGVYHVFPAPSSLEPMKEGRETMPSVHLKDGRLVAVQITRPDGTKFFV